MKQSLFIMALVLFSTGCGVLKVNSKGCKTDAVWGASPNSSRGLSREKMKAEEDVFLDIKGREQFSVFFDREVWLSGLLEEHNINCSEVKKLRMVINTSWFFWREISLKVVKN